jgi:uncharacterized damage-inducible protein DinB
MGVNTATPATIAEQLPKLERTAQVLAAIAASLSEDQAHQPLTPGEWSAHEVVAHLRGCVAAWGGDIQRMLEEPGSTWTRPDPNRFMERLLDEQPSFRAAVAAFAQDRAALLDTLGALSPEQWETEGTIWGRRHTVFSMVRRMAHHEAAHVSHLLKATAIVPPSQDQA